MQTSKVLLLMALLLGGHELRGACVASRTNTLSTYANVQLIPQGFPAGSTAVEQGMAMWNASTCNGNNGTAFPWFQLTSGATRVVNVNYINGASATTPNICGSFSGSNIFVYTRFRDAQSGNEYPCPPGDSGLAQTVAHELGHMLGLDDVTGTTCSSYIMSEVRYTNGTYNTRSVKAAECARAATINDTPTETTPSTPTGPVDPTVCHNCGNNGPEPLILDLDGDGIALSGPEDPVTFDIDGDGVPDLTTWTARGSDDAFLYLDTDHDRFVDGGGELFGSVTGRHSFEALQKLDWPENGGNDDGIIDHHDRAWARLRLWIDRDHDGRAASSGEIVTLPSQGIKQLELQYVTINQPDARGNQLDYRGAYVRRVGNEETFWDMYGVTFTKQ